MWLLDLSPAPCHSFEFFDLQDAASVDRLDVFSGALTVLLELLVHVQQQLLNLRTGHHILLVETRADAKMKRLFRLLLLGPFFKAGSLSAKPQLNNFHSLWHVLAAVRDDTLHVAPLGTDESASDLELALVRDLNVISASVLSLAVTTRAVSHVIKISARTTTIDRRLTVISRACSWHEVIRSCL